MQVGFPGPVFGRAWGYYIHFPRLETQYKTDAKPTIRTIATRYALNRRQFPAHGRTDGVLLLDYLTHQTRLLPRIARAYALGFAHNELVQALVHVQGSAPSTELDQRQLETRAAGLKAVTTWFANDTLQEAREACGGAGYLSENHLTALRDDVDVFATFEGDNTVLLQLVTKGLLTNYNKEWSELDRSGVVQATTRVLGESVVEAIAANVALERLASSVRREPEKATLVDRRWQAMMFEDRANHSLESLARRMRAASRDGKDTFEAFNRLGNHVQFVAKAHMERVIFQAFIDGIEACKDAEAQPVLAALCNVFALDSIGADRAWFLEHNRMSSTRAKAVGAHIEALCRDLRPRALPIVEGMGVPKTWLHAAIIDD